jgi:hypothetical protein
MKFLLHKDIKEISLAQLSEANHEHQNITPNEVSKWHIWFLPTHNPKLKKPKEPFFANALTKTNND